MKRSARLAARVSVGISLASVRRRTACHERHVAPSIRQSRDGCSRRRRAATVGGLAREWVVRKLPGYSSGDELAIEFGLTRSGGRTGEGAFYGLRIVLDDLQQDACRAFRHPALLLPILNGPKR